MATQRSTGGIGINVLGHRVDRDRRIQKNHDMKRLLLLLVPLVLADPAIAFDGGWYDKRKSRNFLLINQRLLASIQSFTNPAWTSK